MEILKYKIKEFLALDTGSGYGRGRADGTGFDSCDGMGCGLGAGVQKNYSCGYGTAVPDGDGRGRGVGEDNSFLANDDYIPHGEDTPCVGFGIKVINGYVVYRIDDIPTIITSVRGNVAQGFIVQSDLQLKPCYVVKENNKFAHGETLHDAFNSLQEKLFDDSSEEERLDAFKKKFPEYDVKYDNRDLFKYHHILTGSCRMGRELFVQNRGLSLDDKTSVREFVELTRNAYGGDIIKKLPGAYGVEQLTNLSCERKKKEEHLV